jgi:hypothetical protein
MPDDMMNIANAIGKVSASQDKGYHQATDVATISGDKSRDVAKIHAGATVQAAQIAAQSRLAVASTKAQNKAKDVLAEVQSGKVPPDRAAVQMQMLYELADDEDPRKPMYGRLATQFQEAALKSKREGAAGRVDPNGMGVGTVEPQQPNLGPRAAGQAQVAAPKPPQGKTKSGASYTIIKE